MLLLKVLTHALCVIRYFP